MMLKSFGCSFIFGTDLSDDGRNGPYARGSNLTWPALLAKDLGYLYQTHARPGSGNLQILERILSQSSSPQDSIIYVIGWSYIDRFDYIRQEHERWPGAPWRTVLPLDKDDATKTYYKHFHNQTKDKLSTLIYVKTAIDSLKQKNIPFIMTYTDELMFETEFHTTPAVIDLQNYIRPYMTTFEGKTFVEWSQARGFEISATMHPLEEAHQAAFELVKSNLDTILHRV